MDLVQLYEEYRKEEFKLVNKDILNSMDKDVFAQAAKILDLADEQGNLKFTNENQIGVMMDFAVHEIRVNEKNAVDEYIEKYGAKNEIEEKILGALMDSYTSLFRVVNISESKHMLFSKDVFNQTKNIRLIDLNLSKTVDTNVVIFTRILPFPEINMTSGASLVFSADLENTLMNMYKNMIHGVSEDIAANKFIIFYSLYKQWGMDVHYNDITHDHDCSCGHDHHYHH
jgi:hypothetical protein